SDKHKEVLNTIHRVLDDNKIEGLNRQIARHLFSSKQVAELWYTVDRPTHKDYGFATNKKLRVSVFSPWDGSRLYPLYDDYGDLIAFSREYSVDDPIQSRKFDYLTCYTAESKFEFVRESGYKKWALKGNPTPNPI